MPNELTNGIQAAHLESARSTLATIDAIARATVVDVPVRIPTFPTWKVERDDKGVRLVGIGECTPKVFDAEMQRRLFSWLLEREWLDLARANRLEQGMWAVAPQILALFLQDFGVL